MRPSPSYEGRHRWRVCAPELAFHCPVCGEVMVLTADFRPRELFRRTRRCRNCGFQAYLWLHRAACERAFHARGASAGGEGRRS